MGGGGLGWGGWWWWLGVAQLAGNDVEVNIASGLPACDSQRQVAAAVAKHRSFATRRAP